MTQQDAFEYKVINKTLMVSRRNKQCAWVVESNIFELVKSFILWNYSADMLPMIPPTVDENYYPELKHWYIALSKPNPPYTRTFKKTKEEYKEWLQSLDLSKPFDRDSCNVFFIDAVPSKTIKEVDEIAITEAENEA
jgi:hypothetical protein